MCFVRPVEVIDKTEEAVTVLIGNERKEFSVGFLGEDVPVGHYVLVWQGHVVQCIGPEEAKEILDLWDEVDRVLLEVECTA